MPILETVKSSWADEVEEGDYTELPGPTVVWDGDVKTITEYKRDDEGRKVKVIRKVKVETKKVLKDVARRRTLKKFGMSKDDGSGPDPATTICAEEVNMQFVTNKDFDEQQADDTVLKLKNQGFVKCRVCRGDHWTSSCPYKDKLGEPAPASSTKPKDDGKMPTILEDKNKPQKYVPPSRRDGAGGKGGESMAMRKGDQEWQTIRVTNLSESTRERDLEELFKNFGTINRIFLGKDKNSGASKGFAFISYARREDAEKAIKTLNGYGYDHLILNVEWSKPQQT